MQTLQFTGALKEIVKQLKVPELLAFIGPLVIRGSVTPIGEHHRDQFAELVMASQVGFARLQEDPATKRLMESLNVGELYTPQRLGRLIRYLGNAPTIQAIVQNPEFFVELFTFYDALMWVDKLKNASVELLEIGKIGPDPTKVEVLEVRILDYENTGIEVNRIQQFFAGMNELHAQVSILLRISDSRLKVLYVDSGTDLYAGFQCAKAVLDIMRSLLSEFWEKYKYSSFQDFDRQIDSLSKGLTFVGAVKEQVDSGAIDSETGKNLTYRVLSQMAFLTSLGVSLPQDSVTQTFDQRKLLTQMRGVKLLSDGGSDEHEESGKDNPDNK